MQKAVKDDDLVIRAAAIAALGKIGDQSAQPELIQALDDSDNHLRASAAIALGQIGSKVSIPKLLQLLLDKEHTVLYAASDALTKIGDDEVIAGLLKHLKHPSLHTRRIAAKTLGLIGNRSIIPELAQALKDSEEIVVVDVAVALVHLNCCLGILVLTQKLENLTPYEDLWGYFSFDMFRDLEIEAAIPVLLKALESESEEICGAAASALARLLHKTEQLSTLLLPSIYKALKTQDQFVLINAISILRKIHAEEVVTELLSILCYPLSSIRVKAASALAELGDRSGIPILLQALEGEDVFLRSDAAFGLVKLGDEDVVTHLLGMMDKGSSTVQKEIVRILRDIGDPRAIAALKQLEFISPDYEIAGAISAIQNSSKFYNYEIAYSHASPGKLLSLYFSYAPEDEDLQNKLAKHLKMLERQGVITSWDSRKILPGEEREQVINDRLNTADIILLLISPDSMADDHCYEVEIRRAIARHQAGEAHVIPILLRPVNLTGELLGNIPVLPKNGLAVTLWDNQDEAFRAIAAEIQEVAIRISTTKS